MGSNLILLAEHKVLLEELVGLRQAARELIRVLTGKSLDPTSSTEELVRELDQLSKSVRLGYLNVQRPE